MIYNVSLSLQIPFQFKNYLDPKGSHLTILTYLDHNHNQIFDEGDLPLPDITIIINHRKTKHRF